MEKTIEIYDYTDEKSLFDLILTEGVIIINHTEKQAHREKKIDTELLGHPLPPVQKYRLTIKLEKAE